MKHGGFSLTGSVMAPKAEAALIFRGNIPPPVIEYFSSAPYNKSRRRFRTYCIPGGEPGHMLVHSTD